MTSAKKHALIAAMSIALCAPAQTAPNRLVPPAVPQGLEMEAGWNPFFLAHAVGTQNYICVPGGEWVFIGPQATGFDDDDEQVLTHFHSKNPERLDAIHATWQHSRDTSAVWATRFRGSSDPAYVAPDAIEWLLLEVSGDQVGPNNGDKLAGTKYIQRVNTVGGLKPPAAECTPQTVNTRKMVDYKADYYFYR
jgi:uncharacterized protein DUF3455